MPWGILYVFLISYPRVLAVPPIPRVPFIRISYFISNGIGSAANIPWDTHTYLYFHTRWCWRCAGCGQYPRGHSYVSLLSYPRILVVPPITLGGLIRFSYFIFEDIEGAAITPSASHTYLYIHTREYWW